MRRYAPVVTAWVLAGVLAATVQAQGLVPGTSGGDSYPGNGGADVWRDTELRWTPGPPDQRYDVYFGAVFADVNEADRADPRGVLVRRNQQADTYKPGRLEFARTYYWRVDEVGEAPGYAIIRGEVRGFTTERFAYRIEEVTAQASSSRPGVGPEHTIDGSGLDDSDAHATDQAGMWLSGPGGGTPTWLQYTFDRVYRLHEMWVWNYNGASESVSGFGLKDVTIEYSADGIDWATVGDFEFAQATARGDYRSNTTVGFGGVAARHLRITVHSNWGGLAQSGLSEVRFFRFPTRSHTPTPAVGAIGVKVDSALRWQPGREAVSHELHISTDMDAVIHGMALVDVVSENRFPLASLDLGQTYYWRVDEVNHAESPRSWAGDLWSFTTQEYMVIDDFEGYDDDKNRIYDTWIDGYEVPSNGSQVGHLDASFAEQMIVRGGSQSMPLFYDNGGAAAYSEAEITWSAPQNWIARGADTLMLSVRGSAGNDPEPLYIAIEDNVGRHVVLTHPDSNVVRKADWQLWRIPFSELGAVGMYMTSISKLAIGLGNRDHPTPGGSGVLYIDDILIGRPVGQE